MGRHPCLSRIAVTKAKLSLFYFEGNRSNPPMADLLLISDRILALVSKINTTLPVPAAVVFQTSEPLS